MSVESDCWLIENPAHIKSIAKRWVIECVNVKGEVMELNIFNKLQKYFKNGDVDSLNYYFAQSLKLFSGNSDIG